MSEVISLESKSALAAEDLAASLSHWQVLDIVHIHREGRLHIWSNAAPWKPLQELIDLKILKKANGAQIVAAHRFRPVLESLWRSGRVKRPAEVV